MKNDNPISIEELAKDFEGTLIDLSKLPQFDQDALQFFTDETQVQDPYLVFTFQHEITRAIDHFPRVKERVPNATLTSFLTWSAVKSLSHVRQLKWRRLGNTWYQFENLPVFMPVATGRESRLASTFLYNVSRSSFLDWNTQYQSVIQEAKEGKAATLGRADLFYLAHNIVNLPHLRFTAIKPQMGTTKSTHAWWMFGQRYKEADRWFVPLMIRMNHANGDPVILQQVMSAFQHFSETFV